MRVNLYAEHADARNRDEEEDTDVEVDYLQAVAPWQDGEREHRRDDYEVGREGEEEAVDMVKVYDFLDQHLEHIGKALQKSHGADAVRAEAALESGAKLTLVVYIE